jgi:hypothetical protein
VGPKFSKKERGQMNLSRFYAIGQIEYCRNFIFKLNFYSLGMPSARKPLISLRAVVKYFKM